MKRKIICCVLVSSLLFSIGCYNNQTIRGEQLNATTKKELEAEFEHRDITVLTKDFLNYKFLKGNYRIQGDTLSGFGVQIIAGNDSSFHGSISFADIVSLKTTEFNLEDTLVVIGIPFLVGAIVWAFLLVFSHSISTSS